MSQFKQYSFKINYPTGGINRYFFAANEFVRPEELLSAVNQHGEIKIHGIVDTSTPQREHEFYLIGTGHSIPPEIIDRIFLITPILLGDQKYGYHLYGVKNHQEEEKPAYKFIEVIFNPDADDQEISDFFAQIHLFVTSNSGAVKYESRGARNLILSLTDRAAMIEKSEEFLELRSDFEDRDEVVKSFRVYNA